MALEVGDPETLRVQRLRILELGVCRGLEGEAAWVGAIRARSSDCSPAPGLNSFEI